MESYHTVENEFMNFMLTIPVSHQKIYWMLNRFYQGLLNGENVETLKTYYKKEMEKISISPFGDWKNHDSGSDIDSSDSS